MKVLLDTHTVLWWLSGEPVGQAVGDVLARGRAEVLLSAAVVWEIAIKRSLGKLEAPRDLTATLVGAGARPLPITLEHAAAVERLPWHHRDPFDRVLIAQATVEGAALASGDPALAAYGVPVVWD